VEWHDAAMYNLVDKRIMYSKCPVEVFRREISTTQLVFCACYQI